MSRGDVPLDSYFEDESFKRNQQKLLTKRIKLYTHKTNPNTNTNKLALVKNRRAKDRSLSFDAPTAASVQWTCLFCGLHGLLIAFFVVVQQVG